MFLQLFASYDRKFKCRFNIKSFGACGKDIGLHIQQKVQTGFETKSEAENRGPCPVVSHNFL